MSSVHTIIVVDDHLNTPEFDEYRATLAQGGKAGFVENYMNMVMNGII